MPYNPKRKGACTNNAMNPKLGHTLCLKELPCPDHPKSCICGPEGKCDYHAVTDVTTPINQQCWCAAKAEAKDAVCPIHG